jgi:hypothetical protein
MKRPLPKTPAQWHKEIKLAIADAADATPFAPLVGTEITADNLFHLAPVVCLKFRGKKLKGREADRVTKVALANYVANSDPEGIHHGLEQRPLMAFTLCYVTAHLALDLVDEEKAEAILKYCEEHLDEVKLLTEQPKQQPLAAVEADLFGTLIAFHKKTMTLVRESSLDDEKIKVVGDRIKTLLDNATAEMKATQQVNLTQRLDAAFDEVKRLVEELSHPDDGKKAPAKPRKAPKNKP